MPKQASPYLNRLSSLLNQQLGNIARVERDKQKAYTKAAKVLQAHFKMVLAYSQRKFRFPQKLSTQETAKFIADNVADALKDYRLLILVIHRHIGLLK